MEIQNKVYLRKIDNINIDPIFSDFYSFLNRRVIEKIFYDNYMLCSWILRSNLNSLYDVFYCKGTDNLDFSCKKISQIFFNYSHKFIYPNYKEYKEYYELNINRINLNNQILKKILYPSNEAHLPNRVNLCYTVEKQEVGIGNERSRKVGSNGAGI